MDLPSERVRGRDPDERRPGVRVRRAPRRNASVAAASRSSTRSSPSAQPELAQRLRCASAPRGARTWNGARGYIRRVARPGLGARRRRRLLQGSDQRARAHRRAPRRRAARARGTRRLRRCHAFGRRARALRAHPRSAQHPALRHRRSHRVGQQWDDPEIAQLLLQLNSATADEVETLAALEMEKAS